MLKKMSISIAQFRGWV